MYCLFYYYILCLQHYGNYGSNYPPNGYGYPSNSGPPMAGYGAEGYGWGQGNGYVLGFDAGYGSGFGGGFDGGFDFDAGYGNYSGGYGGGASFHTQSYGAQTIHPPSGKWNTGHEGVQMIFLTINFASLYTHSWIGFCFLQFSSVNCKTSPFLLSTGCAYRHTWALSVLLMGGYQGVIFSFPIQCTRLSTPTPPKTHREPLRLLFTCNVHPTPWGSCACYIIYYITVFSCGIFRNWLSTTTGSHLRHGLHKPTSSTASGHTQYPSAILSGKFLARLMNICYWVPKSWFSDIDNQDSAELAAGHWEAVIWNIPSPGSWTKQIAPANGQNSAWKIPHIWKNWWQVEDAGPS